MDNRVYSEYSYQSSQDRGERSTKVKLDKVGVEIKQKFSLHYDFGDDWMFTITVQKIAVTEEKITPHVVKEKGFIIQYMKTVYGEVTYQRAAYETADAEGRKRFVHLPDETLELDHAGLVSTNMAELLVSGITEMSYQECAAKVSRMTGQSISAMGVWNVIQALGAKVCEEEKELTKTHKVGKVYEKKKFRSCLKRQMVFM